MTDAGMTETAGAKAAGMGAGVLIRAEDLGKTFPLPQGLIDRLRGRPGVAVHALSGVSFDLMRGETLGIVGESGCGKSTLARCLVRLHEADSGRILFEGADIADLSGADRRTFNRRVQMIFQDPYSSLNPRMTVRQILAEALSVHRMRPGAEIPARIAELLDLVRLPPDAEGRYPHEFSGGQRQRIGIARALAVEPEVLVADELVSALDVSVQAQVVNLLLDLQDRLHLTVVFVAHDLRLVRHISHRVAVMYLGKIVEIGPTEALFAAPRHPYTRALLDAAPETRPRAPQPVRRRARRTAEPDPSAEGLPLQHPLPACLRALFCRTAAAFAARAGPSRRLSSGRLRPEGACMSYADFQARIARINDVLCAINILGWDARTQMPPGGVDARGHQVATLTALARAMATGDDLRRAIDGAREELAGAPKDDLSLRALDLAEGEIAILARIPARITEEMAGLSTRAHAAWAAARAANDFAGYAPLLERMMAMQREISSAIGTAAHPYDPMVARFEPGMTHAELQRIYGALKEALVPLIQRAKDAPQPRADFLSRSFPIPQQKAFGLMIAERLGYDLHHGRLDDTVHPFEISFTRDDVRITSRFREDWLPGGIFALWHEAGHGMYEQGGDPARVRSIFATDLVNLYAVNGASFGMHESQSRLWENRVGRSEQFWDLHFGALRDTFPDQLRDVGARDFWRSVNRVHPGFIRVEADELTYDMHIILRTEIEAALMTGDLQVADIPAVWAEKMRDYLGVEVPDDTRGALQDVHWSHGYLGSFPTYTLGNIMASQFFAAASREAEIAAGLESGDYAPLRHWLTHNIYRHGRASSPKETLLRATGSALDPAPYIADLTAKVDALTA